MNTRNKKKHIISLFISEININKTHELFAYVGLIAPAKNKAHENH